MRASVARSGHALPAAASSPGSNTSCGAAARTSAHAVSQLQTAGSRASSAMKTSPRLAGPLLLTVEYSRRWTHEAALLPVVASAHKQWQSMASCWPTDAI